MCLEFECYPAWQIRVLSISNEHPIDFFRQTRLDDGGTMNYCHPFAARDFVPSGAHLGGGSPKAKKPESTPVGEGYHPASAGIITLRPTKQVRFLKRHSDFPKPFIRLDASPSPTLSVGWREDKCGAPADTPLRGKGTSGWICLLVSDASFGGAGRI